MTESFTPSPRVLRVSVALLIGLFVAVVLGGALRGDGEGSRLQDGGDFPAFYSAGLLTKEGRGKEIYSHSSSADAQLRMGTRHENDGFLLFGYPPYVAALFAPLTVLPFERAVEFYFFLTLGAWFLSVGVLVRVWPSLHRWYLPIAAFGIVSYPTLRALLGGQNSTISVLCLLLALWLLGERRCGILREVAAGVALGLWMFKPQLALPFFFGALLWRRWWVAVGAGVVGAFYWMLGVSVGGSDWLLWWLHEGASTFYLGDLANNSQNFINLRPVVHSIFGMKSDQAELVAMSLSVILLVVSLLGGFLHFRPRSDLHGYFAFLVPLSLIASPHALYYDAALLVVPCAWLLMKDSERYARIGVVLCAASWISPLWSSHVIHPVTIICFVLALFIAHEGRGRSA